MKFVLINDRVPGLVIASEEIDLFGVEYLQAEEEHDCLYWVVASIDEISNENVSCVGELASWMRGIVHILNIFSTS